jgi:two-component system, cell cycle response regulator CtrA
MCKLLRKLAKASARKNYIETVWGRGYVLRHPAEEAMKLSA